MKNYICILFLSIALFTSSFGYSQNGELMTSTTDNIDGLSIYPNPVSSAKVFITSTENLTKDIEIFNVLGKKIQESSIFGKELNISKLTPGIYILKIKEGTKSTTRKLVVR